MATKAVRRVQAPRASHAYAATVVRAAGGIGSRLRPLVRRGQRALAESIVDLDQPLSRRSEKGPR